MEDHKKFPTDLPESAEQELLELEELLESSAASSKKAEGEEEDPSVVGDIPFIDPEGVELEEDIFEPTPSRMLDLDFSDMEELHRRASRSEISEIPDESDSPVEDVGTVPEHSSPEPEAQPILEHPSSLPAPPPVEQSEPDFLPEPEVDPSAELPSGSCDPAGLFFCDPLPRYNEFIFQNLQGRFLFTGESVVPLEQGDSIREYGPFVVDFYGSPGPGVLLVEGVHKYAAVLGRRKLQQQGEITDEFLLRPMQSLKMGKNETSLFYQLVPRAEQAALLNESENSPEGFLLHDTVSMLHGLLRNMSRSGPTALALHLPEAVLLLAGDRRRIVWARRYTLAGDDMNALRDGFEIIAQDLQNVRRESGVHIREVAWIESFVRTLEWPEYSSEELHFTRMPVFALQNDEGAVFSALPGLMSRVESAAALTEPAERILVSVGRWEKILLFFLLIISLMVGGAGYWLEAKSADLDVRKQELTRQKHRLSREYSSVSSSVGFLKEDSGFAAEAARVAEQVGRVGTSSPLAALWNSLAELRPKPCRVQALEITYENELAKIRMEGVVDLGLTQAQSTYSSFLRALKGGGFHIRQQSFQLDVDSNFFSLVLEKRFSE